MTVGELGEFGVIARITGRLPQGASVLLGPGDDAAMVSAPDGRIVVSTDLLLESRHFRRDWSSGYDVGRKAAAQNLADAVAMGAVPTSLVVGLALPADLPVAWLEELTDGLRDECDLVGASVAGGDVTRGPLVVVSVTVLGDLGGRAPVLRSGARPGQVVAVAGRLGWAAAGLALLEREGAGVSGSGGSREVVEAHRRPCPPYAQGPEAAVLGATAMLDVSDGLVQDLGHIAAASGVGIVLEPASLPIAEPVRAAAERLGVDPLDLVLAGGEDHALAAVFPCDIPLTDAWTVVGRVVEGAGVQVSGRAAVSGGWDHFR
ncbi:thiamine-phosphate kinase [Nonomuraea sp. NPDC050328]|uniref:thiamine-phosphate kinase n=1 Tax=Nonomuraea sp. NPDC050328 TaxID=3364361 RepID=UPI00378F9648